MDKMRMDRVSCHVTAKCNLRCRMCAVYIPRLYELGNVPEYDIADIKESFRCYFELVSHVRLVSLTGGEPMLYPHLAELLEEFLSYEEAYDKLEVFTNGSLDVPDPVFSALAKSGKMMLFIDHYGPKVSRKAEQVAEECEKRHIRYTLREYYGPNAHMGGVGEPGHSVEPPERGEGPRAFREVRGGTAGRKALHHIRKGSGLLRHALLRPEDRRGASRGCADGSTGG